VHRAARLCLLAAAGCRPGAYEDGAVINLTKVIEELRADPKPHEFSPTDEC
jgi:hypothetical protein